MLAPIIGTKRKLDEEAEMDIIKQNTGVPVGFRNAYVFDVSHTEGTELPTMREMRGTVGENRERILSFIKEPGIEIVFTEKIVPLWASAMADGLRFFPASPKPRSSAPFSMNSRTRCCTSSLFSVWAWCSMSDLACIANRSQAFALLVV
jgi:hypothetical protein